MSLYNRANAHIALYSEMLAVYELSTNPSVEHVRLTVMVGRAWMYPCWDDDG